MIPCVLYENSDLIVCVKPHGVPSQPDPSGVPDMTAMLREHLSHGGDVFVVHRLDRAVGGVMVYAKTKPAAAALSQAVADKDSFEKIYLAVICGEMPDSDGRLEDFIYKDAKAHKAYIAKQERKGVKHASLDYITQGSAMLGEKKLSLLKIKLNTGRFHQIRVQLASRGFPICGDGKYGSREKHPHIALWSYSLSFDYKGKHLTFTQAPSPDDRFFGAFQIK